MFEVDRNFFWYVAIVVLAIYLAATLIIHIFLTTTKKHLLNVVGENKKVCLLVAHPDDEAMFFGPCVRSLLTSDANNQIYVLCLTSGNYYGLGRIRMKEMKASCLSLASGCLAGRLVDVSVVDEPEKLADGPKAKWDRQLALRTISAYIKKNSIDCLITFDRFANFSILSKIDFIELNKNLKNEFVFVVVVFQVMVLVRIRIIVR